MSEYVYPFRLGGSTIPGDGDQLVRLTYWEDAPGQSAVTMGLDIAEPIFPGRLPSSREKCFGLVPSEVLAAAGVDVDSMQVANPQVIIEYLKTLSQ